MKKIFSPAVAESAAKTKSVDDFKLKGGYPDKNDIAAIYDELDFQRAVQSYIWATPAVGMEALSDGLESAGISGYTTIGVFENFLDANTVVATGNGQSLYAFGNI